MLGLMLGLCKNLFCCGGRGGGGEGGACWTFGPAFTVKKSTLGLYKIMKGMRAHKQQIICSNQPLYAHMYEHEDRHSLLQRSEGLNTSVMVTSKGHSRAVFRMVT